MDRATPLLLETNVDPELLEEIGAKPTGSPDAREMRAKYLDRLAEQVKGEREVGRIKVRMKERHILEGQGIVIHKGHVMVIGEESFEVMNKRLSGKLERLDKPEAMQEREMSQTKDMKPEDTVTKEE